MYKETKKEAKKETGIPFDLQKQYENYSGYSFDDVQVHYRSQKPKQFNALAYTQGSQVYIAPGQEKHLKHELSHVIQQKQNRVKPTLYMGVTPINNEKTLEIEADAIINKLSLKEGSAKRDNRNYKEASIQGKFIGEIERFINITNGKKEINKEMFQEFVQGLSETYCIGESTRGYIDSKLRTLEKETKTYNTFEDLEQDMGLVSKVEAKEDLKKTEIVKVLQLDNEKIDRYIKFAIINVKRSEMSKEELVNKAEELIAEFELKKCEKGGKIWTGFLPNEINNIFQEAGSNIVNEINSKMSVKPLRIAGSTITMGINPQEFIADDIDIDYYCKENPIEDNNSWKKAKELFSEKKDTKILNSIKLTKVVEEEEGDTIVHSIWSMPTGKQTVEIELKNVSGDEWNQGWKEGEKRELGNGVSIPIEQLYIDTILRVVAIIDGLIERNKIDKEISKDVLEKLKNNFVTSIEIKNYILKKKLLKKEILDTKELAEKKLDKETYEKYKLIDEMDLETTYFIEKYIEIVIRQKSVWVGDKHL